MAGMSRAGCSRPRANVLLAFAVVLAGFIVLAGGFTARMTATRAHSAATILTAPTERALALAATGFDADADTQPDAAFAGVAVVGLAALAAIWLEILPVKQRRAGRSFAPPRLPPR